MKKTNKLILLCAILGLTAFSAIAQEPNDSPRAKEFYRMTQTVQTAFLDGDLAKAESTSVWLLKEAESWKENWNYGNAVHAANLTLGRVALAQGEMAEAKTFLLKAGATPGSPQLNSFGPDMNLARDLLKQGEKETVLRYFDLCEVFWKKGPESLKSWRESINRGEVPEFGANLRYFFYRQPS
jgi:hypothetical protein